MTPEPQGSSPESLRIRFSALGINVEALITAAVRADLLALSPQWFAPPVPTQPSVTIDLSHVSDPGIAVTELTAFVLSETPLLGVHAAVVRGATGYVVFPGVSGLGKTTLSAALTRAGFGYVSDEVLAVDRSNGTAFPFARPLALDAGSWRVLGLDDSLAPGMGEERLVGAATFGSVHAENGMVSDVVLAHRMPGRAVVREAGRASAVASLVQRSFNHYKNGADSFRAIAAIARTARVHAAEYEDANSFANQLADLLL